MTTDDTGGELPTDKMVTAGEVPDDEIYAGGCEMTADEKTDVDEMATNG